MLGLLLAVPGMAMADAGDIPGTSTWYLHVDFDKIRSDDAGRAVYDWMEDEIFSEVREDAGIDLANELDQLTAFSVKDQGPVILFEGNISQNTKDMVMTLIAAEGDLLPKKSSGKAYYRFGNEHGDDDEENDSEDSLEVQFEALAEESWISMALDNKVLITSSEDQMQDLLAKGGKLAGGRSHDGALLVLTAEKALLQAGLNSSALGGDTNDGDSGWDSNILRNTEQVAFLVAAKAGMLALEAKLVTTEADMAESLASVVRGLISLVAFDDEMDDAAIAVLRSTKVEAKGNKLSISLAIAPDLLVSTLGD